MWSPPPSWLLPTPLAAVQVREGWLAPASFNRQYTCSTDSLCISAPVYFNKIRSILNSCMNHILLCQVFHTIRLWVPPVLLPTPLAVVRVREGWLAPASFNRQYTCSTDQLCINAPLYFNKSQQTPAPCINHILKCRVFYKTIEYRIGEFKKLSDYRITDQGHNLPDYRISDLKS